MKKIILLSICLVLAVGSASAQNTEDKKIPQDQFLTKNGYKYLPVAGDFAIGIDIVPYFANVFSVDPINLFSGADHIIYGKYFLKDDRVIRAKLKLNLGGKDYKNAVPDDFVIANGGNAAATTIDTKSVIKTDVELWAGYEFRRGHGRVQGFYGGEFMVGYTGAGKEKYKYGNAMTDINQSPTSSDFNSGAASAMPVRDTEIKYGNTIKVGLGAFAGAEYFFAPHMSVGAEFSLNLTYTTTPSGKQTIEFWDAPSNRVQKESARFYDYTEIANSFGVKTNISAGLMLMFYF